MGQELLGLYFIVCFNKIEHFIRDSACNYVRNVAQWEHYTSTRALELICPAPHHQPHQSHLMGVIVIISLVISGPSMEISSRLQQVDSYWPFWSLLMWLLKWVFVLLNTTGHYQTSLTSLVWDVGPGTTIWILQPQTISCLACLLWKWNLILVDKMITLFN